MFAQAGLRDDHRLTRIRAVVWRREFGARGRAAVLLQYPTGEYAWGGRRGISWPEQVQIRNLIPTPVDFLTYWTMPRSELRA